MRRIAMLLSLVMLLTSCGDSDGTSDTNPEEETDNPTSGKRLQNLSPAEAAVSYLCRIPDGYCRTYVFADPNPPDAQSRVDTFKDLAAENYCP